MAKPSDELLERAKAIVLKKKWGHFVEMYDPADPEEIAGSFCRVPC